MSNLWLGNMYYFIYKKNNNIKFISFKVYLYNKGDL